MEYQLSINQKRTYNKGVGAVARQKFCKGVCEGLHSEPPYGKKYVTHVFCRRCGTDNGMWMKKEAMKANGRCPCCNFHPSTRSRKK